MEKQKVSFIVEKIVEEPDRKGAKLLKVFIRSGDKQYTKVCKKADYLNKGSRISLHKLWIESIKEQTAEDKKDERELKKDTKALEDLVGSRFKDEED